MSQFKFGRLPQENDEQALAEEKIDQHEKDKIKLRRCCRFLSILLILLGFIGLYRLNYLVGQIEDRDIRCVSQYTESCSTIVDNPTKLLENLYGVKLYKPEQLHVSLGSNGRELFITWSTGAPTKCDLKYNNVEKHCFTNDNKFIECQEPSISVQSTRYDLKTKEYKAPKRNISQSLSRTLHTYRARMTDLDFMPYVYYVECSDPRDSELKYKSEIYQLEMKDFDNPNRELAIAFYGDLGLVNAQSVPRLIKDVDERRYDLIIHNGDFAYDLNTNNGRYGDEFMREIEPIAARVPYQTSVGNHEIAQNFSHYDHRFTMIQSGGISRQGHRNNFFYSFNAGPVHFVGFSTEFYYFVDYIGLEPMIRQYKWLVEDLQHASTRAEREKRPWIVVFGHRPMYCSSRDRDDCTKETNILRKGLPLVGYGLEELFYKYGVDVELYSHEHQYERFLPIYNSTVMNGTNPDHPYYNPKAPVHLISGSAGCEERLDPFNGKSATGSVKKIADYGYTRIYANKSAIRFEQISDDRQGTIMDSFTIEKDQQNFP